MELPANETISAIVVRNEVLKKGPRCLCLDGLISKTFLLREVLIHHTLVLLKLFAVANKGKTCNPAHPATKNRNIAGFQHEDVELHFVYDKTWSIAVIGAPLFKKVDCSLGTIQDDNRPSENSKVDDIPLHISISKFAHQIGSKERHTIYFSPFVK